MQSPLVVPMHHACIHALIVTSSSPVVANVLDVHLRAMVLTLSLIHI